MRKSTNRRKATAVALAVIGVAGLSLASAAQLNLTGTSTVQSGALTVAADCQSADVTVTFDTPTLVGGEYTTAKVNLGAIDAKCVGSKYKLALIGASGTVVSETATPGTVAAGGTIAYTLPTTVRADSITKIALSIYK